MAQCIVELSVDTVATVVNAALTVTATGATDTDISAAYYLLGVLAYPFANTHCALITQMFLLYTVPTTGAAVQPGAAVLSYARTLTLTHLTDRELALTTVLGATVLPHTFSRAEVTTSPDES